MLKLNNEVLVLWRVRAICTKVDICQEPPIFSDPKISKCDENGFLHYF